MTDSPWFLFFFAVGVFLAIRSGYDRYLAVGDIGVWRTPPRWLRTIARSGDGPILATASLLQLWCMAIAAVAIVILLRIATGSTAEILARTTLVYIGLAVIACFVVVALVAKLRRRG